MILEVMSLNVVWCTSSFLCSWPILVWGTATLGLQNSKLLRFRLSHCIFFWFLFFEMNKFCFWFCIGLQSRAKKSGMQCWERRSECCEVGWNLKKLNWFQKTIFAASSCLQPEWRKSFQCNDGRTRETVQMASNLRALRSQVDRGEIT